VLEQEMVGGCDFKRELIDEIYEGIASTLAMITCKNRGAQNDMEVRRKSRVPLSHQMNENHLDFQPFSLSKAIIDFHSAGRRIYIWRLHKLSPQSRLSNPR